MKSKQNIWISSSFEDKVLHRLRKSLDRQFNKQINEKTYYILRNFQASRRTHELDSQLAEQFWTAVRLKEGN